MSFEKCSTESAKHGHTDVFSFLTLLQARCSTHKSLFTFLSMWQIVMHHANESWKMSRYVYFFLNKKGKKSPDYQHCKWGKGRTCLVSQVFLYGIISYYSHLFLCPLSHTCGDIRKIPVAWQTLQETGKRYEKNTKFERAFFTASSLLQISTS